MVVFARGEVLEATTDLLWGNASLPKPLSLDIQVDVVMSVQLLRSTAELNEARTPIFGALCDPTRLRILQTLLEAEKPMNVTEVYANVRI